ncbi:MAG: hypothetical protein AAF433_12920 [Bacteroidota bacterium]
MSKATKIRDLIIKGRLSKAAEELLSTLDAAAANGQQEIDHARNEAIILLSRLNELKQEESQGLLSTDNADQERNRIRKSLIDLNNRTRDLGKPGFRIAPPAGGVAQNTGDGGKPFPWPWAVTGLAVVALLAFILWPKAEPDPVVNPRGEDPSVEDPMTYGSGSEIGTDINNETSEENQEEEDPIIEDGELFKLTILPNTQAIGQPRGKSGHLVSTGGRAASPPQFGDTADGKEIRGFLTFSLEDLPPSAEIVTAQFFMDHGGGLYRELDKVFIKIMDVGENLEETDYDATARPIATLNLANFDNTKSLDLRQEIQLANRNGRKQITLRFQPNEVILNGQKDVFAFRYGQGRTRLELEFK